jgi:uncharacterized protein with PIN domain
MAMLLEVSVTQTVRMIRLSFWTISYGYTEIINKIIVIMDCLSEENELLLSKHKL